MSESMNTKDRSRKGEFVVEADGSKKMRIEAENRNFHFSHCQEQVSEHHSMLFSNPSTSSSPPTLNFVSDDVDMPRFSFIGKNDGFEVLDASDQALSEKFTYEQVEAKRRKKAEHANTEKKIKALRLQVEELRQKLSSKLQEVEDARKDKNEMVKFMYQSCEKARRDVESHQREVEIYKGFYASKLAAEKACRVGNNSASYHEIDFVQNESGIRLFRVTEMDARLVALLSVFLSVHHRGAHIDYISSYLENIIPNVRARDVEALMRRFPNLFQETTTGIGASLERTWKYLGLQTQS